MASTSYSMTTVDGNRLRMTRTTQQGRPPKDADLKRNKRHAVNLTGEGYKMFIANAERFGMTPQEFSQMALTNPELFVTKNS